MLYFAITLIILLIAAALLFFFMRKNKPEQNADIDLRGRTRPRLTVRLPKRGGTLILTTPTKALADSLSNISELLTRIGEGNEKSADIRELYRVCAMILDGNIKGKEVTPMRLSRIMTPDDCLDFLGEYLGWLTKLTTEKN